MSVFGTLVYTVNVNSSVDPAVATFSVAAGDLVIVGWSGSVAPTGSISDTVGNTYVLDANANVVNGFGTKQYMYYCLASIGANASNIVSIPLGGATSGVVQVWKVPISGGTALFDVAQKGSSNGAANPVTAAFTTTGADEFVALGVCTSGAPGANYTAGGTYTLDSAGNGAGSITKYGGEHIVYTSTQTGITPGFVNASANYSIIAVAIKGNPLFSISGSASAGAKIWYVGTASGSVTADGSGNYTVPNLANGSYTLWATAAFKSFLPLNRADQWVG